MVITRRRRYPDTSTLDCIRFVIDALRRLADMLEQMLLGLR